MGIEAVAAIGGLEAQKKNRIQVSNTKKPLFFYVNLAKRYIQQHNDVELSALGMAITTVVTIAEILKNNGLAIEKSKNLFSFLIKHGLFDIDCLWNKAEVSTSTVSMKDENKGRVVLKAKIEIVLGKSDKFDLLMNASNVAPETDTKNKE
ncbi:TPX2 family protein, putative isoform 1 [Hibiscus syriacus]|uniref:TPX2 family protein, putative isoform 1 n=1 Tax=Hibiscus syriacus TaxID=106335 RepID=A0A6A2X6W3_HIBSY|nr:TPX2 family protein, putative isoform 1 [Hibiscus syriacus]